MKTTQQSMVAMKGQAAPGMVICNCMCSWQPVRVMHGDGHVRSIPRPVTVGELLKRHPHHFVCEPTSTGPLYHSGMLPLDMELEEGRVYLLLPLPRLLPHLQAGTTTFPTPPCCPCFSMPSKYTDSKSQDHHHSRLKSWLGKGQLLVAASTVRQLRHRLVRSLVRMLPERLRLRLSFQKLEDFSKASSPVVGKSVQYSCSRNRWRPGLECISEVGLLTGLLLRDAHEVSELTHMMR